MKIFEEKIKYTDIVKGTNIALVARMSCKLDLFKKSKQSENSNN